MAVVDISDGVRFHELTTPVSLLSLSFSTVMESFSYSGNPSNLVHLTYSDEVLSAILQVDSTSGYIESWDLSNDSIPLPIMCGLLDSSQYSPITGNSLDLPSSLANIVGLGDLIFYPTTKGIGFYSYNSNTYSYYLFNRYSYFGECTGTSVCVSGRYVFLTTTIGTSVGLGIFHME